MNHRDIPIFENDLDEPGVIQPGDVISARDTPDCAVICFFKELIESVAGRAEARELTRLRDAFGEHPIYELEHHGRRVGVFHPGVGASLAVGMLEEAIALGFRRFVAVGGAGALVPDLVLGHAIVVSSAVRDEGTSFHYLAPSRTVDADPEGVAALEATLSDADVPFVTGRTWITDSFYRETRSRVSRRVQEGCLTVEMEASAFIAAARYRNVRFAELLYAGDSLAGDQWDDRGWPAATDIRTQMFWHAVEAATRLDDTPASTGDHQ